MTHNLNLPSYKQCHLGDTIVCLRGQIFSGDKIVDYPKDLRQLGYSNDWTAEEVSTLLAEASGCFSLVIASKNKIILASDLVRTFPLHVVFANEGIMVTDSIEKHNDLMYDDSIISEYIHFGFVTGSKNIYTQVASIQAAEIIVIEDFELSSERYFKYLPNPSIVRKHKKIPEFVADFNELMSEVIDKMLLSAPSVKNWIVPLSGGHDSRILGNELFKKGIKNVICFSYGTIGNKQSEISKQVAEAVDFKWHFVEYTEDKWDELHKKGLIDAYINTAFQGISTPHLQDFLAVYELKEKGIVSSGDIFVPGHTLDFISGGHFKDDDQKCKSKNDALQRAVRRHTGREEITEALLYPFLSIYDENNCTEAAYFQEFTNWQERQAKFIVNSCRVYEFWGFEFRLPFWDKTLMEFLLAIPPMQRLNRNLTLSSERKGILVPALLDIPFEDELVPKGRNKSVLRKLKTIIPMPLKNILLRMTGKKQRLAEGMNQIFTQRGDTVEDIIGPLSDFPKEVHDFIKPYLKRHPYQMNAHLLVLLYTCRKVYNRNLV